jgi:hypothetical protein
MVPNRFFDYCRKSFFSRFTEHTSFLHVSPHVTNSLPYHISAVRELMPNYMGSGTVDMAPTLTTTRLSFTGNNHRGLCLFQRSESVSDQKPFRLICILLKFASEVSWNSHFTPEDGGNISPRNVGIYLQTHTALEPRTPACYLHRRENTKSYLVE